MMLPPKRVVHRDPSEQHSIAASVEGSKSRTDVSRRQLDRTRIDDARLVFLSSSSRGFETRPLWLGCHTPAVLNQSHSPGCIDLRAVAFNVLYRGA